MSLVAAGWLLLLSVAGSVDPADEGSVLDAKLPRGRDSASVCRVVVPGVKVEGGDPRGTVEALRKQDGDSVLRNIVCSCVGSQDIQCI